jgi:hypothetical protein
MIQQKVGESREKYLRKAANFAREEYKKLLCEYPYWSSHESFALRDALLNTEKKYSDLGTFGVEYIAEGKNKKSPEITYLNSGDSYGLTILVVRNRFIVACWADIVERGNYE